MDWIATLIRDYAALIESKPPQIALIVYPLTGLLGTLLAFALLAATFDVFASITDRVFGTKFRAF